MYDTLPALVANQLCAANSTVEFQRTVAVILQGRSLFFLDLGANPPLPFPPSPLGVNNINDFPENRLIKFRVLTVGH